MKCNSKICIVHLYSIYLYGASNITIAKNTIGKRKIYETFLMKKKLTLMYQKNGSRRHVVTMYARAVQLYETKTIFARITVVGGGGGKTMTSTCGRGESAWTRNKECRHRSRVPKVYNNNRTITRELVGLPNRRLTASSKHVYSIILLY